MQLTVQKYQWNGWHSVERRHFGPENWSSLAKHSWLGVETLSQNHNKHHQKEKCHCTKGAKALSSAQNWRCSFALFIQEQYCAVLFSDMSSRNKASNHAASRSLHCNNFRDSRCLVVCNNSCWSNLQIIVKDLASQMHCKAIVYSSLQSLRRQFFALMNCMTEELRYTKSCFFWLHKKKAVIYACAPILSGYRQPEFLGIISLAWFLFQPKVTVALSILFWTGFYCKPADQKHLKDVTCNKFLSNKVEQNVIKMWSEMPKQLRSDTETCVQSKHEQEFISHLLLTRIHVVSVWIPRAILSGKKQMCKKHEVLNVVRRGTSSCACWTQIPLQLRTNNYPHPFSPKPERQNEEKQNGFVKISLKCRLPNHMSNCAGNLSVLKHICSTHHQRSFVISLVSDNQNNFHRASLQFLSSQSNVSRHWQSESYLYEFVSSSLRSEPKNQWMQNKADCRWILSMIFSR